MFEIDKRLQPTELELLQELVGSTIVRMDAVLVDNDNSAWNTVRIHTKRGAVDISNLLEELPLNDEGDTEEYAVMSVAAAPDKILVVDAITADTSVCFVNQVVSGVLLAEGRVKTFYKGELLTDRTYTQAVILRLSDDSYLVFDKEVWFEEIITIKQGENLAELLYDESPDWEDDLEEKPDTHFELTRALVEL